MGKLIPNPSPAIKNLGYVTVSSKGISNGLSGIPNDGADFGPDTPNSTGTGLTQTSGIQEAINYVSLTGGVIKLEDGIYDITNASFQPAGYSYVSQILLPSIPNDDPVVNISIIGNPASRGGIEGGQPYNQFSGGVTIRSTATVPSGDIGFVIASPTADGTTTNLSNINLFIDGIHIQTQYDGNLGGISLDFITGVIIGKLYIDTNSPATFPTTISSGIGIMWGNGNNSSIAYADEISAVGYHTGIYLTSLSHMQINKIMADMCVYGTFVLGSTYGGHIGQYDYQNCAYGIYFQQSSGSAFAVIGLISMGDQQTSGYPYDYVSTVYDPGSYPDATSGGIHYLKATLLYNETTVTPSFQTALTSVFDIEQIGQPTTSTTNGTTAGTVTMNAVSYKLNYKKYVITFNGYENDTTTDQVINFPLPFNSAIIITNNTGLTINLSTTVISITSPNSTTTYSGFVIVEGY